MCIIIMICLTTALGYVKVHISSSLFYFLKRRANARQPRGPFALHRSLVLPKRPLMLFESEWTKLIYLAVWLVHTPSA